MYYIFFISTFLFYLLLKVSPNRLKAYRIYIGIMTIMLSLCSSLRNLCMGVDTSTYYSKYVEMSSTSWDSVWRNFISDFSIQATDNDTKDVGYQVITKLLSNIMSWEAFQFFVAFLLLSALGYLIYKNVRKFSGYIISYCFYISLYYHFLPNAATRQTIALGLLLWAYILWIERKKRILAIFLFIVGLSCHASVIIGVLPVILLLLKNKNLMPQLALVGFVIMLYGGNEVVAYLTRFLGNDVYASYAESEFYISNSKPVMFIVQMFAFYFVSRYSKQNINALNSMNQLISISFYIAVMLAPVIWVDPSAIRADAIFGILGVVFLPNIVTDMPQKHRLVAYLIILALILGRPLLSGVTPFYFIWDNVPDYSY